jgi:hypothetical protein
MTLMRIRAELARSHNFPEGSTHHAYQFILPLTGDGRLDTHAYAAAPQICTVHRFWNGEDDEVGQLTRTGRGGWAFSFRDAADEDEPIHKLPDHVFRLGEYLSVREPDGQTYTFRIVLVEPAPGLAGAAKPGG